MKGFQDSEILCKIRETVIHCGWEHIRGCKWCGIVLVEWEGTECDGCNVFICNECNEKYGSHCYCLDVNEYYCRDCSYRCSMVGCEKIYREIPEELERCSDCAYYWCKIHTVHHFCEPQ